MNIEDARDAMLGHATAGLPVGFTIVYKDVPAALLTGTVSWSRVTVKHVDGGQRGFGDGTRKYVSIGILCVEVFTPVSSGAEGDTIAQGVKTYLESIKSSPIWYRNIRAVDIGRDGGFEKINVYADFEYEDNH